jgi:prepilin-type N-terminal cleavage/methylation domain-containing protein
MEKNDGVEMMFSKKGVTLIELIVALTLFAIAVPLVGRAFYQGVRATAKVRASIDERRGEDRIFLKIETDLRNALPLSAMPFEGASDHFAFPVGGTLKRVRYAVRDGALVRFEEDAARQGVVSEMLLAQGIEMFVVEYAYRDETEKTLFLPYWAEEPYSGLPRAVRVRVVRNGNTKELLVSLPQGHFGKAGA